MKMAKEKKKVYIRRFILIAVFIIAWFMIHFALSLFDNNDIRLSDEWTVQINDEIYSDVCLDGFSFPTAGKGDVITLTKTLENYDISQPSFSFKTYHSMIDIYLDDEQIYTFGHERYEKGLMVGSGMRIVSLPDELEGKELKIVLHVTEDAAFTSIDTPELQRADIITGNFLRSKLADIITVGFLSMSGVILLFIYLFFRERIHSSERMLFYISVVCICAAVWISCYSGILGVFSSNLYANTVAEYISLYLMPLFVTLFVNELLKEDDRRLQRTVYIMALSQIAFVLVNIAGFVLNIFHLQEFLTLYQLMTVIILVGLALIMFMNQRKNKSERATYLLGAEGMVVVLGAIEVVRFNIQKYLAPTSISVDYSLLPLAALLLMIAMVITYLGIMTEQKYRDREKEMLFSMAYTDALTGIGNRAKFEENISDNYATDKKIGIIGFDLNNFKQINDSYGHGAGDEALKIFSKLLNDHFSKEGFVARVGGDEFVVIIEDKDYSDIQRLCSSFINEITEYNSNSSKPYKIQSAFGMAFKDAGENISSEALRKKADDNMYTCKKSMKGSK